MEGVASLLPKELDPAAKEKLEALQTFIVDQVSANADHKKFAPRIKGMVNGLTQIRAIDRMKALAASGETDIAHVKAWEKLRNPGVHPTKRAELDIASIDYQKLIDKVHSVVVLMYHILFSLIGYKGGYTDYSVHGYPQRQYPVSANAAPAETAPALAAAPPVTKVKKARPRKARTTKPPASKKGAKVAAKRSKASAAPKPRRSRIKK